MSDTRKTIMLAVFSLSLASSAFAQGTSYDTPSSSGRAGTAARSMGNPGASAADWARQHRASKIMGTDVYDLQGKKIGAVRDIVVDPQTGNINYAVVSFGGVMGVGGKYFAVPWKSLQTTADAKNYALNIDRDALKSAPGFDKDHWPDMANQQWVSDVERYWQSRQSTGASDTSRGASGSPSR